jgi:hypothetical protein
MDYRKLTADVHQRPSAYGLDGSYGQAVAFITGCDAGNDWGLLTGFPQWLAMKLGQGANLAWPVLVLRLAFPSETGQPTARSLSPQHNDHAVATLFGLLDEFLEARQGPRGAISVLAPYFEWEQSRKPTS